MHRPTEDSSEAIPPEVSSAESPPEAPPRRSTKGRITYRLDWAEYWRASEICWRAATGKLFLRLVPASGWVGILAGVVMVALDQKAELAPIFWLFGLGFLSSRLFRLRSAKRNFRKRPAEVEMGIEWGPGGVTIREGGNDPNTIPWEGIRVVLGTSAGFLVEPRRHPSVWLPFSGFEVPEGPDLFEGEVDARGVARLDRSSVG